LPRLSLRKTIEATKLNKRTGLAEVGPEVTIPFGALVEFVSAERETVRFSYMGDYYRCAEDLWQSAAGDKTLDAAPAPVAAATGEDVAVPPKPGLIWETLSSGSLGVARTRVPGGWLVAITGQHSGLTFLPDPAHEWDGTTLAG
jgi:hypothetical protein